MSFRNVSVMLSAVFAVGLLAYAAEEKAAEFKATCPVSGKAAVKDKTADYKKGTVYFCCGDCAAAFAKDSAKFSTKANLQLAATGQTTQVKCPLSGAKLNPEQSVEVSGVKVQFCCDKCKGKVADAKGDAQVELAFSNDAFEKGFEVKKK